MPRIYAPNGNHNMAWGEVDFTNGVAAMMSGADTSYFQAEGYDVDNSKHVLTLLDALTITQLQQACDYLGVDRSAALTKQALVRALETSFSAKYIAAVTVASTAGATAGTSDIAITGEGTYKYKTGKTTAPVLLYMDFPDDTWGDIVSGDDIEPGAADHDKITVVKLNDDGYVIGIGNDDLTLNAG